MNNIHHCTTTKKYSFTRICTIVLNVLVFPPFLSKYRFLAHKAIDEFFFPQLCSFSVGQDSERRVVVGSTLVITRCCLPYRCVHEKSIKISKVLEKPVDCICSIRLKSLSFTFSQEDLSMPSSTCDPSPKYVAKENDKIFIKHTEKRRNENRSNLRDRQKRPDKQIYVPRALRATQSCIPVENKTEYDLETNSIEESDQAISDEHALKKENEQDFRVKQSVSDNKIEIKTDFVSCENLQAKLPFTKIDSDCTNLESESVSNTSSCLLPNVFGENSSITCTPSTFEINILHNQSPQTITVFPQHITNGEQSLSLCDDSPLFLQDSEPQITDNSVSLDSTIENTESKESKYSIEDENVAHSINKCKGKVCVENEDSWETKFDEDGECLNPEFLKDLKNVTGQIEVLVAKNNYKDFQPICENNNEGYDNIVELYNFPREFSTQDLVSAFSQFQQSSFSIKWVDDCHALAVFSSPTLVNQALMLNHPFVKVRPISEGIKESKVKAKWCARHSEPVKPRPTTSAVLARRLVSGALGLRVRATKEQREQERSILNDAKEKRRLKAQQKQAIWDGKVL